MLVVHPTDELEESGNLGEHPDLVVLLSSSGFDTERSGGGRSWFQAPISANGTALRVTIGMIPK
jgi:hypothetical protein